ncbi:MAG: Co2+/Mg2+ efflux protein ApaG [Bacteroidota bacterium]
MVSYAATTEGITIAVRPVYLDGESDAMVVRFVFAYFVRIENDGLGEVQLLRRHWIITDETGKRTEVEGEGVVGQQPVLQPGDVHEYQSFCVLETFTGTMEGTYLMQRESGERFRAQIPRFHLAARVN